MIGEGGYGCVIRPAVSCQGNQKFTGNDAYVSKILYTQDAAEEMRQAQAVREMLENNPGMPAQFFSIPEDSCGFQREALTASDQRDCKVIQGEPAYQFQVLQSRYGGMELRSFLEEVVDGTQGPQGLSHVTANMLEMLHEAIVPMNQYGIWHCDLKSQNILVHTETADVTMIDWGMMKTRERLNGLGRGNWHFMWNAPFVGTMIKGIVERGAPYLLTRDDVITIMTNQGSYDNLGRNLGITPVSGRDYRRTVIDSIGHLNYTLFTIRKALRVLGLASEPDNVFQVIDNYQRGAIAVLNGDDAPTAEITPAHIERLQSWFFENVDKWGFVCSFRQLLDSHDPDISRPTAEAFMYMFATTMRNGEVEMPGGASPGGINPEVLTVMLGRYIQEQEYGYGEPMEEGGGKKARGKKTRGNKARGNKARGKMVRGRKTRGKKSDGRKRRSTRRRQ